MAETQQPGDGESEHIPGPGAPGHEPPPGSDAAAPTDAAADATAETTALPAAARTPGVAQTPGRGTAAPLGTVGDGRYRLTHRLGRGGMAEVFAAQDVRLARTVAVKLLRSELAQDDVARLRFTREAHSVAGLNHHSIVAVYDTGEEQHDGESTPYIVMELVEGRTVRELLVDEEAPPVDQALIITAGVLEALAYSHQHGIVHRDIKPANVIITTSGAVKVMDFGIARALTGAASTMTQTGMVMGTPQYLSPEQALGKAVDHRSDLYAAGCMLYELLTLRPPFVGETPLSVVYQHVQDAPVPPSQANERVPGSLDELVLRSLAKNPDDRFQSAEEFRAHLQHALREMHGAAGAGYGLGAAGLAAAAAATTQLLPPTGGGGGGVPTDSTTAMPYPGSSPHHTPTAPYAAEDGRYQGGSGYGGSGYGGVERGGSGYGGSGGDGPDGEEPNRRRSPWPWVIGVAVLLLAAGLGIALALNSNNSHTTPPANPVTSASSPTPSPSESTPQSPSRAHSASPSETPSSSPSPSPSPSSSPSPSASPSSSPSTSPSSSPSSSESSSPPVTHSPTTSPPVTNPPPTTGAPSANGRSALAP